MAEPRTVIRVQLPEEVDLEVYGIDTWSQTFTLKVGGVPEDLTGWTFAAQMREVPESPTAVDLVVSGTHSAGEITLSIPPAGAVVLPVRGVWDVRGTKGTGSSLEVRTFVGGKFSVRKSVTRV